MKQHSIIRNIISTYYPVMNEEYKVKLLSSLEDIQEEKTLSLIVSLLQETIRLKVEEKKLIIRDLNDKLNQQGIKLTIK